MRLLFAEDEKELSNAVSAILRHNNYSVDTVYNGIDAKDYVIIAIGVVVIFIVGIINEKGISVREKVAKLPFPVKFVLYMAAILVIIIFGAYGQEYGVQDLIYANF